MVVTHYDGIATHEISSGSALIQLVFDYLANDYRIDSVSWTRGKSSLLQYEIVAVGPESSVQHSFSGNSVAMTPLIRAVSLFDEYMKSPFGDHVTRIVWSWRRNSEKFYELKESGVDPLTSLVLAAAGYEGTPDLSPPKWKKERLRAVVIGLVDDDSTSADTQTLYPLGYLDTRSST